MLAAGPCTLYKLVLLLIQLTPDSGEGQVQIAIDGIERGAQLVSDQRENVGLHLGGLTRDRDIAGQQQNDKLVCRGDGRDADTERARMTLDEKLKLGIRQVLALL